MDTFQKYSRLMLLIVGSFIGFLLLFALIIFVLRLFSVVMFNIPGFDLFFQYVIILIPYLIFFAAYFYLYGKIALSKSKLSRYLAAGFIAIGCLLCLVTLGLSTAVFFKVNHTLLRAYDKQGHYAWIIQLVLLFATAGILASGDEKEKDWLEKHRTAQGDDETSAPLAR